MTIYAYYRVSTDKQDYESQRFGVLDYASRCGYEIDEEVVDDGVSGTVKVKDRKLGALLKKMKAGDILLTSELSRLGRSASDVINTCQEMYKKGIQCYMIKNGMSVDNSPMGKLMIAIFSAFAEMERDLISMRTKEGLAKRKAEGVILGRKLGVKNKSHKLQEHKEEITELLKDGWCVAFIARKFNVAFNTIQNFIKRENIDIKITNKRTRKITKPYKKKPENFLKEEKRIRIENNRLDIMDILAKGINQLQDLKKTL